MRFRILAVLVCLSLAAVSDAKSKMTKITVEVKNHQGEPVDRAAVIVKPVKGKKVKAAYELRTSQKGTAPLPPLQQGQFLVQVIAQGYQTHGETYTIKEPERTIEIRLNRPAAQFSVHK